MKSLGEEMKEIGLRVKAIEEESTSTFSAEDAESDVKSRLSSMGDRAFLLAEKVTKSKGRKEAAAMARTMAAELIWTARLLDAMGAK